MAIHCDLTLAVITTSAPLSVVPISNSKARALQLLGITRGSRGRFHEQLRFLREAVVTLKKAQPPDLYLLAYCYTNLSFSARDFGVLDDIVQLELVETTTWPRSLHWLALEIQRSCGWLYALAGDDARAFATFERLAQERERYFSRDGFWLAVIGDAMIVADASGVGSTMLPDQSDAASVAESFDWTDYPEQRFALSLFARALAKREPDRAGRLIEMDDSLAIRLTRSPTLIDVAAPLTPFASASCMQIRGDANRHTNRSFKRTPSGPNTGSVGRPSMRRLRSLRPVTTTGASRAMRSVKAKRIRTLGSRGGRTRSSSLRRRRAPRRNVRLAR